MARRRKFDPDEQLDPDQLEELEEEENDGILRDGQSVRVPLYLKDGSINPDLTPTQRGKAAQQVQDQDAVARKFGLADALQMHKPGFRRVTDAAALERVQEAYRAYDAADAQAYKQTRDYSEFSGAEPRNTGTGAPGIGRKASAGAYPYSASAEGSSCTVNGAPGRLRKVNGGLECVPDRRQDAATVDAKQAAYDEYDRIASNAWRSR
jgi:hypothetical protein